MRNYQVTAKAIFLKAGLLQLTPEQAKGRAHNLEARGDGTFEVIREVCFKRGEQFGFDGQLGKGQADAMKTAEEIAAEEKAKADAEAQAQKPAARQQDKPGLFRRGRPPKGEGNAAAAGAGESAGVDPLNVEQ